MFSLKSKHDLKSSTRVSSSWSLGVMALQQSKCNVVHVLASAVVDNQWNAERPSRSTNLAMMGPGFFLPFQTRPVPAVTGHTGPAR